MLDNRLKELRLERGLTQQKVAESLNVSQPNYRRWETGERSPSSETLKKLADYFNVSTDFLLGRDTTEKIGLDRFIDEIERRYDDVITLSFMDSDFLGFCVVIEEIALNSLRVALGTKMNDEITKDYNSAGYKRQSYLSNFENQIDDKTIKSSNIPHLKETILEQEQQIASKYFEQQKTDSN